MNPRISRTLNRSPQNHTENRIPNTDSRLNRIAALEGSAYFCPMFCSSKASAVQATPRYKTPNIDAVSTGWGGPSNSSAAIQQSAPHVPNCKIVIRTGSFPALYFDTATMWDAKKNPLRIACQWNNSTRGTGKRVYGYRKNLPLLSGRNSKIKTIVPVRRLAAIMVIAKSAWLYIEPTKSTFQIVCGLLSMRK